MYGYPYAREDLDGERRNKEVAEVKRTMVMILGLCLLLAVSVAALGQQYGGTLQVALGVSPPYLDWHQTTAGACEAIACHIFETLTTFDDSFEDIPQLATWDLSEDRLTWTFHLREGVNFQKGYGQLTAEDVKASVERFQRVAERGEDFDNVAEIVIVDPLTIQFKLSAPTRLLTALSTTVNGLAIYPKAILDEYGDEPIPADGIIGTGPYELEEWTEEQVVIVRFDDYTANTAFPATGYGGERIAYLDKIVFNYVPEATARIAGLETGKYHVGTEIPLSEADRLERNDELVLKAFSPYYKPIYFVNCTEWPTSDPKIRLALRLAADMERVLNFTAYGKEDFYSADNSVFFDDQKKWWSDAGLDKYSPNDDEAAKQLMEEAGYDGAEIFISTTRDYDWIYRESLALWEEWTAVGFNCTLAVYPWAAFVNHIQVDSRMHIWCTGLGFPVDPDANAYVFDPDSGHNASLVMGDASNNPTIAAEGYISETARKLAEIFDEEYQTDDFETRYAMWEEIQTLLLDDPFCCIIGNFKSLNVLRKDVMNYKAFKRETFWNVWLET